MVEVENPLFGYIPVWDSSSVVHTWAYAWFLLLVNETLILNSLWSLGDLLYLLRSTKRNCQRLHNNGESQVLKFICGHTHIHKNNSWEHSRSLSLHVCNSVPTIDQNIGLHVKFATRSYWS